MRSRYLRIRVADCAASLAKLGDHVLAENISSIDEFVRRFVPELERHLCDPESVSCELEFQFPRKLKLEQQGQLFNQRDQNHSKREFCRLLELHQLVALLFSLPLSALHQGDAFFGN